MTKRLYLFRPKDFISSIILTVITLGCLVVFCAHEPEVSGRKRFVTSVIRKNPDNTIFIIDFGSVMV